MAKGRGTIYSAQWQQLRRRALRELPPYCGRCGGFIDLSLPGKHPLGPQLDHQHARALGGEHVPQSLDGLMLSHARCNARHGQAIKTARESQRKGREHRKRYPNIVTSRPPGAY